MARKVKVRDISYRFEPRSRLAAIARIRVAPYSTGGRLKPGFRACVLMPGVKRHDHRGMKIDLCASGKNPRKAIAAALHATARHLARRRGAFAGINKG